jgi:hypothetical protein
MSMVPSPAARDGAAIIAAWDAATITAKREAGRSCPEVSDRRTAGVKAQTKTPTRVNSHVGATLAFGLLAHHEQGHR